MFGAEPFSNIPFCGSTFTPIYPHVWRDIHRQVLRLKLAKPIIELDIHRQVLGLKLAKPIIELNVGTERTVLVLKIAAISLNLIRK